MFGIGLTLITTFLLAYVVWRLCSVSKLLRVASKKAIIYCGLIIWIILLWGRLLGHGSSLPGAATAEFLGITITGVLFLIFICLFPVDLITGFGWFFPHFAPRLRGWAMIAGCLLSVVATIQGVRPPVISHHEVKLPNLPRRLNGTTLVVLSDLHLGSTLGPKWLESRVAQVQALKPDIIFLLGDTFEGHGENIEAFVPALQKLAAPYGVWSVNGNHENHGQKKDFASSLKSAKIITLQDELIKLAPGLILAGRDVIHNRNKIQGSLPWNPPPEDLPPGSLILLSHIPEDFQTAAESGVNLMLSGHTHGGQLWPFSLLVATVYSKLEGRYEVDDMTLLVCRGTGTWGPRMRLWRPSEILYITLLSD
ncbi:MAG: metallophosphoesterase [Proteobacteria bacterium]|nr:metallophosphoesterase [Pseudomonadota bacterium]